MKGSRSVAWLVLVLLLAVGASGAAFAKTINVPAQYATIQAAIKAAAKGDVVVVAAGTYKENIDFKGKAITVRSTDPTNKTVVKATIINGNKHGSVVTFKSGETAACVLSGFTITNGTGTLVDDADFALMGGGVLCNGSSPTLTNNTISGNKADNGGGGGGVACYEDSSPTLTNNTITGNSADGGGGVGVECWNGSSPTLTNNTITGNSANGGGGVGCFCHELIASDRFSLTLTNNTISGNSATGAHGMGGGVDLEGSSATLTNNTISGNWVNDGDGGGVACEGGSPTLTNNTITGNSATDGGGVYCRASSSPIIKNTIIALSTKGGGLSCDSGDGACNPVVTYCDVWGNVGGDYVKFAVQTGKHGNLSQDPLFADAAARDFHLKSPGGRWTAAGWVLDTVTSPCLDAGDPKSACNLEPAPNGGRINMGAYGGTIYASKSP